MMLAVFLSLVVIATCQTIAPDDHLLKMLQAIHHSNTFKHLPNPEKIILVELISAAEVDQITHYIDRVGMPRILIFLDHVNTIDQREAHLLETLLVKELNEETGATSAPATTMMAVLGKRDTSLRTILQKLQSNAAYQNLSQSDKDLMTNLVQAASNHTVSQMIHQVGYASVIELVEHIGSPSETHLFLTYLVQHMNQEHGHGHHNPQPIG